MVQDENDDENGVEKDDDHFKGVTGAKQSIEEDIHGAKDESMEEKPKILPVRIKNDDINRLRYFLR